MRLGLLRLMGVFQVTGIILRLHQKIEIKLEISVTPWVFIQKLAVQYLDTMVKRPHVFSSEMYFFIDFYLALDLLLQNQKRSLKLTSLKNIFSTFFEGALMATGVSILTGI